MLICVEMPLQVKTSRSGSSNAQSESSWLLGYRSLAKRRMVVKKPEKESLRRVIYSIVRRITIKTEALSRMRIQMRSLIVPELIDFVDASTLGHVSIKGSPPNLLRWCLSASSTRLRSKARGQICLRQTKYQIALSDCKCGVVQGCANLTD